MEWNEERRKRRMRGKHGRVRKWDEEQREREEHGMEGGGRDKIKCEGEDGE